MNQFESRLGSAFPSGRPSSALDQRVSAMSASQPRRSRPKYLRLSFASAFAAVAVFGAVLLVPRLATASVLSSIGNAASRISHYRLIETEIQDDGTRGPSRTTFYLQGQSREVRPNAVIFSQPGARIAYYPSESRAVRYQTGSMAESVTNLGSIVDKLKLCNWVSHVSVDRVQYGGRDALRLAVTGKNEPVVTRMYADAATELPFRAEIFWRTPSGALRLQREVTVDYSSEVTRADVEPRLPSGTHVVDDRDLREDWSHRFAQHVAVPKKGAGRLVIRNVSATPEGYVYVVYTGGQTHSTRTVGPKEGLIYRLDSITDSRGMEYVPVDTLQGTMYTTTGKLVSGYVIDGEDIEVAAFAPLGDTRAEWPTAIRLVFNQRGPSQVDHDVMLSRPNSPTLPEYLPYLGIAPSNEHQLASGVTYARGSRNLQEGDNATAERWFRESVRESDLYAASIGQHVLNGQTLYYLGLALVRQGKSAEARATFERALNETNPVNEFPFKEIKKELANLQAP